MKNKYLTLILVLGLSACGGGSSTGLGTCPTDSAAQELAGRGVVNNRCVTCHSSMLSGAARASAPTGRDYDVLSVVRATAADMWSQTDNGQMPPTGAISASEKESLRVWLACGARDVN